MIYWPKTKDEARAIRYNRWGGNPEGSAYAEGKCAAELYDDFTRMFRQCSRLNGYGPDHIYCCQHSKKVPK